MLWRFNRTTRYLYSHSNQRRSARYLLLEFFTGFAFFCTRSLPAANNDNKSGEQKKLK